MSYKEFIDNWNFESNNATVFSSAFSYLLYLLKEANSDLTDEKREQAIEALMSFQKAISKKS